MAVARVALTLCLFVGARASVCSFNKTADAACPADGAKCSNKVLCASGFFCKKTSVAADGVSFFGTCAKGPLLSDVYRTSCAVGSDLSCQFQNPLALDPYQPAATLQCRIGRTSAGGAGVCLIGPNKDGDGCNENAECASGKCATELRVCKGIDEGLPCTPSLPDPCRVNHYCAPDADVAAGGTCAKAVSPGAPCKSSTACARGFFCSGASSGGRGVCAAVLSVPTGANTTLGPYMCASGTALLVDRGGAAAPAVMQCVDPANVTALLGAECPAGVRAPAGFECACAGDGKTRFRSVGGFGLGSRAQAFRDLNKCLLNAQNPMGEPCLYDAVDLETVRYGSCGFYACYPFYQALANSTGGRFYAPPLNAWSPAGKCEVTALTSFYQSLMTAGCISIPNMESWKCASLAPPMSISVGAAWAVVIIIMLGVTGLYMYHMKVYSGSFSHIKFSEKD